jgi:hypothetical protein
MKKTLIVFVAMFVWFNDLYAQTPLATIQFEERLYNFGTILEKNGKVSHTFVFKNNGKTPVVINDIYSGCGCIGKTHSEKPVPPGAKGSVTVTFDPGYKSGFFSKEIVVCSNSSQNYNRIWVEGNITPAEHPIEEDYLYNFGNGLYLRLKVMAFGYAKSGETKQMELHYANATDKEMILNFAIKDNKAGLKFNNPGKIGAKAKGIMTFSYTMPTGSKEDVVFTVYPYVNNKRSTQTLEVKILSESKRSMEQNSKAKSLFHK